MKKAEEAWIPSSILTTKLYDCITENKEQSDFSCMLDNMIQANQIAFYALNYDINHRINNIAYNKIGDKVELKITKE